MNYKLKAMGSNRKIIETATVYETRALDAAIQMLLRMHGCRYVLVIKLK